MGQRWDASWKTFFDPKAKWTPWFVRTLLGEEYEDYSVYFDDSAEISSAPSEYGGDGAQYRTDAMLVFTADREARTLHLEFQSSADSTMAYRMLRYGILQAKYTEAVDGVETVQLPDGFVVDVRKGTRKWSQASAVVQLHNATFSVQYPVLSGYNRIPVIKKVMDAKSVDEVAREITLFCADLPVGFSGGVSEVDNLTKALASISDSKVFTTGADDRRVVEIMDKSSNAKKTLKQLYYEEGLDAGIEKGIEKGIEQGRGEGFKKGRDEALDFAVRGIMGATGCSYDEAIDMIERGHKKLQGEGKSKISELKLGE